MSLGQSQHDRLQVLHGTEPRPALALPSAFMSRENIRWLVSIAPDGVRKSARPGLRRLQRAD
jgi:hypothetical protein